VIRYNSIYEKRAWTFQEKLLSQRCLIFTDYQIFYYCHGQLQSDLAISSRCDEGINIAGLEISGASRGWSRGPFSTSTLSEELLGVADYVELIEEYTRRYLSNHSDMLHGVAGILSFLQQRYNWEIICGIPREHLNIGLLWAPAKPGNLKRNTQFSSWSWAGWVGEKSWGPMYQFSYAMLQDTVAWTLHSYITYSNPPNLNTSNSTGEKNSRNEYYLDLQSPSEVIGVRNIETLVERCSLIFDAFTTPSTSFTIGCTITRDDSVEASVLLNSSGEQCGLVFGLPSATHMLNANLPCYEYVLLSRLERPSGLITMRLEKILKSYDKNLFPTSDRFLLNILLVEHTDHGTERLAIGVVHEAVWEKCKAVKKRITLT
jgi:hypothetical protein